MGRGGDCTRTKYARKPFLDAHWNLTKIQPNVTTMASFRFRIWDNMWELENVILLSFLNLPAIEHLHLNDMINVPGEVPTRLS
ncbi:hypothetical protein P3S67_030195 [Capsicum chacoense]